MVARFAGRTAGQATPACAAASSRQEVPEPKGSRGEALATSDHGVRCRVGFARRSPWVRSYRLAATRRGDRASDAPPRKGRRSPPSERPRPPAMEAWGPRGSTSRAGSLARPLPRQATVVVVGGVWTIARSCSRIAVDCRSRRAASVHGGHGQSARGVRGGPRPGPRERAGEGTSEAEPARDAPGKVAGRRPCASRLRRHSSREGAPTGEAGRVDARAADTVSASRAGRREPAARRGDGGRQTLTRTIAPMDEHSTGARAASGDAARPERARGRVGRSGARAVKHGLPRGRIVERRSGAVDRVPFRSRPVGATRSTVVCGASRGARESGGPAGARVERRLQTSVRGIFPIESSQVARPGETGWGSVERRPFP